MEVAIISLVVALVSLVVAVLTYRDQSSSNTRSAKEKVIDRKYTGKILRQEINELNDKALRVITKRSSYNDPNPTIGDLWDWDELDESTLAPTVYQVTNHDEWAIKVVARRWNEPKIFAYIVVLMKPAAAEKLEDFRQRIITKNYELDRLRG